MVSRRVERSRLRSGNERPARRIPLVAAAEDANHVLRSGGPGVEAHGLQRFARRSARAGRPEGGGRRSRREDVREERRVRPGIPVRVDPSERVAVIDRFSCGRFVRDVGDSVLEHAAVVGDPVVAGLACGRPPAVLEDPGSVGGRRVPRAVVAADDHVLLRIGVVPADEGDRVVARRASLPGGLVEGAVRFVHVSRQRAVGKRERAVGLEGGLDVVDERGVRGKVEELPRRLGRTGQEMRVPQEAPGGFVPGRKLACGQFGRAVGERSVRAVRLAGGADQAGERGDGHPVAAALLEDVSVRRERLRHIVVEVLLRHREVRRGRVDEPREVFRRQARRAAALREDVRLDRTERSVGPARSRRLLVADGRDAAQGSQVERNREGRGPRNRVAEQPDAVEVRQIERRGAIACLSGNPFGACATA